MFGSLFFSGLIALSCSSSNIYLNNINSEKSSHIDTISSNENNDNLNEEDAPAIKKRSLSGNNFALDLEFDKKLSRVDVYSNDMSLLNKSLLDNTLSLDLSTKSEFSKAELTIEMEDGTITNQSIFAYKDLTINDVFVSLHSEDDAWYLAKKYGYEELGIYDEDDIYEQYDEFARRGIEQEVTIVENDEISSASTRSINANGNTYVEGHLYWYDSSRVAHPLMYTRVDLYDSELGQNWLVEYMGTTYTDENGYYCFAFNNADGFFDFEFGGYDPMIRIYPDSKTFEVARDWIFNDWIFSFYYKCSNVVQNVSTGTTTTLNITIPYSDDDNTSKSFSIGQAMSIAQEFAHKYANMPLDKLYLDVLYPQNLVNSFSWKGIAAINEDHWNDWEVIMHEYGHYVECVMGTYGMNLIDIVFNDPTHCFYSDHLYDKRDKKFALELTWAESWATTFAMIVYDSIGLSNISFASSIYTYIDNVNSQNIDETESGEGQERAVVKYLWNLYDSNNAEDDSISLGAREFFRATLKSGIYTLNDFINYFENEYFSDISSNGQLLENSKIAPRLFPITHDFNKDNPLTIDFIPNGSFYNPNNKFDIEFYSSDQKYLTKIANIPVDVIGNRSLITYTINSTTWKNIYEQYLSKYGYVYVSVVGYHSRTPESGPFHSAFERIDLCSHAHITPEMYDFPENYCSLEESKAVETNEISFNTKRLRTGYIEDEYVVLCPRKEGYGTAYLEYDFNKSVRAIDIDLSFWSVDERYYRSDYPEARIEYWDEKSNTWVESLDLLKSNLPTDRYKQNKYSIIFDKPVKSFRIYSHFKYMTGYTDRNKGRIAIGNLDVYFA